MTQLDKIDEEIKNGNAIFALNLLDELIDSGTKNAKTLFIRGTLHYKLQNWGKALNDFNSIINLEPEHKEAISFKTMVLNIMNFRNNDLYNP